MKQIAMRRRRAEISPTLRSALLCLSVAVLALVGAGTALAEGADILGDMGTTFTEGGNLFLSVLGVVILGAAAVAIIGSLLSVARERKTIGEVMMVMVVAGVVAVVGGALIAAGTDAVGEIGTGGTGD